MKLKLVKSTKQVLMILVDYFILVTTLGIGNAQAVECEFMQFLKSKSQGVSVQKNLCEADNKVSIGSSFIINPGGRLWLKAQGLNNMDVQLICQNRARRAVEVKFSNTVSPWITPTGFAQCSDWKNNRLSCADVSGSENDFICAIAAIKTPVYLKVTNLERTTSVKMRSVKSDEKKTKIDELTKLELSNAVVDSIRSEVGLCRDLYQIERVIKVSWALDVLGRIEKLSFASGDHLGQKFRSCVESVINHFAYPKFNEDVAFSQQL